MGMMEAVYLSPTRFMHSMKLFPKVIELGVSRLRNFIKTNRFLKVWKRQEKIPCTEKKEVVFRKTYKNTRVSIFQGGHEIIYNAALNWLASQRKGEPAKWEVQPLHDLGTNEKESESGK